MESITNYKNDFSRPEVNGNTTANGKELSEMNNSHDKPPPVIIFPSIVRAKPFLPTQPNKKNNFRKIKIQR